jgi:eukaryotic-like serine/threonine-protein kinase
MNGPDRIGRYAVLRKLGSGGFATVWLARDETLDADVAIKVLAEHWIDDEDVRGRFLGEGRFLRRVDSPYVVGVHDIGETDEGRPFLVLTYADRGTLEQRLEDGPMDVGEAVSVIQQVAAGLRALHNRDLLHRDVKPANVLFRGTPDGERAMLGDLGLGKSLDAVSRLTLPGGTPAYVAPEQVRGDQLDPRADQYALAAVAYSMLSGRSPHGAKTLGAVLAIEDPPAPLRTLRAEVPAVVEAAVQKGLALDREERWPDITAFADALTAAEPAEIPASARPPVSEPTPEPMPPRPRTRTRTWVAAGLAAAVLGAGGAYAGVRIGTDRQWVEASDTTGTVSVRVPRSWAGELAGSGWTPPASTANQPGLLLSADNTRWAEPGSGVPGVFAGMLESRDLPATIAPPQDCGTGPVERTDTAVTAVFPGCPNGLTTYERVVLQAGRAIRIQVRRSPDDEKQVYKVLDSVRYHP